MGTTIRKIHKELNNHYKLDVKLRIYSKKQIRKIFSNKLMKFWGLSDSPGGQYNPKKNRIIIDKDYISQSTFLSIYILCHEWGHVLHIKRGYLKPQPNLYFKEIYKENAHNKKFYELLSEVENYIWKIINANKLIHKNPPS